MTQLFYLQDSRGYVGNDVLWWAIDGNGYTTDLLKAHVYTQDAAMRQHLCRETDIPWPKAYIDGKTRPAVDMQYINQDEALKDTGITLYQPRQGKNGSLRCFSCGRFMATHQLWAGVCSHCGADNRP